MPGLHPAPVRVPGGGQDREGTGEGRAAEGVHPLQRPHRRLPREPQPRHHTRGRHQGETSVKKSIILFSGLSKYFCGRNYLLFVHIFFATFNIFL